MKIPCSDISQHLKESLTSQVRELKHTGIIPKLVTILVGSTPEQLSFVTIKKRIAHEIGVEFKLVHLTAPPSFENFKKIVIEKAREPSTSGIIIQHPFPGGYDVSKVYECIPPEKEIEGFRPDSAFRFPLSLAVLSGMKYIMNTETIKQEIRTPIDKYNKVVDLISLFDLLK